MNSPEGNSTNSHDPVDICVLKYRDHSSIILFWEDVSFVNPFTFSEITEFDIEIAILKMNPKKSVTFGKIPTKS